MKARLRLANFNVHTINEILHDYTQNPAAYEISRFDLHPNPRADERIAAYVSTRILHGGTCRHGVTGVNWHTPAVTKELHSAMDEKTVTMIRRQ